MKIITIDTETSCYNKGNFKDRRNNLVTFQYKYLGEDAVVIRTLRTNKREEVQKVISDADMLVGFNIKFDLHWLRNYGIDISGIRVWDCQLAEYLLESQQNPYNSLNDALQKYGLDLKPDTVKEEYWVKGVNTDDIPEEILNEYGKYDVEGTEEVFKKQREQFKNEAKGKLPLLKLQNADLLVLEDIEYNGVCFDTKSAVAYSRDVEDRCVEVIKRIHEIINIPEGCEFNISSNDHLSAVIYGGVITTTIRTPNGVFATGAKVGQVKYSLSKVEHSFPQLAVPNPKKETKKSKLGDGSKQSWSVAEDVLHSLRVRGVAKELITLVLEHSKLEKLIGTYLQGYTALIEKMNWPKDMLYSNLNQCTAVTGRLSSTRPNAQNANPETKKFMGSRYKDGVLLNYDVKGLEVVAVAYLSQDPILMKELEDGVDIHTANQEAFNLPSRLVAKILKFR
jgi:DNA polymerase-1